MLYNKHQLYNIDVLRIFLLDQCFSKRIPFEACDNNAVKSREEVVQNFSFAHRMHNIQWVACQGDDVPLRGTELPLEVDVYF